MKRLATYSAAFLVATLLGLGLAVVLPPAAEATNCNYSQPQTVDDCFSVLCPWKFNPPHARYLCGTLEGTGEPCGCEFIGCVWECNQIGGPPIPVDD